MRSLKRTCARRQGVWPYRIACCMLHTYLLTWLVPFRNLESITRAAVDTSTTVEVKLVITIYGSGNFMYDLICRREAKYVLNMVKVCAQILILVWVLCLSHYRLIAFTFFALTKEVSVNWCSFLRSVRLVMMMESEIRINYDARTCA